MHIMTDSPHQEPLPINREDLHRHLVRNARFTGLVTIGIGALVVVVAVLRPASYVIPIAILLIFVAAEVVLAVQRRMILQRLRS
jgi:hypothetical protein